MNEHPIPIFADQVRVGMVIQRTVSQVRLAADSLVYLLGSNLDTQEPIVYFGAPHVPYLLHSSPTVEPDKLLSPEEAS